MKSTLLSICFAAMLFNSFAQVNVIDSLALVDLYNSTDGAHWNNNSGWLKGPVSTWYGIYVSGGRVQTITLDNNNLSGTIPSSIGKLTSMYSFQMADNQLAGSIPSSIGKLLNLIGFSLANNHLTGTLPNSITRLTKITTLFLSGNQLSGSLSVLESFSDPVDLELSYNKFGGSLPNLQHIENIKELDLNDNMLSGRIPPSYQNFAVGSAVYLQDNNLTAAIPASLSQIDPYAIFDIQNNHFNFDSLEYILTNSTHYYLQYSPQLSIPTNYIAQGIYGRLSVSAGGTLSNNTYQWYRNNILYKTIVGDSTFAPDSAGLYYARVNNNIVTNLQLTSDTINIVATCSSPPSSATTKNIQATSARVSWNTAQGAIKYQVQYKAVGTSSFTSVTTRNTSINLTELIPNTTYVWKVRSKCSLTPSSYSLLNNFTTLPALSNIVETNSEKGKHDVIKLYPNPAKDFVTIGGLDLNNPCTITLWDMQGKELQRIQSIGTFYRLNIATLGKGIYIVKIENKKTVRTYKLIKQ